MPVRGGGKGQSFFKEAAPPAPSPSPRGSRRPASPELALLSPGLAEKKRKLLSKVLGKEKRRRGESEEESEEEEEEEESRLTIDMERGREERERKEREKRRKDKKRRRKERSLRKERERRERKAQASQQRQEEQERVSEDSDLDYSSPVSPPPVNSVPLSPPSAPSAPPSPCKSADIRTVDLAQVAYSYLLLLPLLHQLGDLFSVATPVSRSQVVTHTITLSQPPPDTSTLVTVQSGQEQVRLGRNKKILHDSFTGSKQNICKEEFPNPTAKSCASYSGSPWFCS